MNRLLCSVQRETVNVETVLGKDLRDKRSDYG